MKPAAITPRQLERMLQQAQALQRTGALSDAHDLAQEMLDARPKHLAALQLAGALLLQMGRLEEGAATLSRALDIDPKQPALLSNLAYALNALHRPDAALQAADRALKFKADFVDALNNRGNALAALHRPADALACFDRVLALQPRFVSALNNRACVLRDLGRADDALASCDEALALEANYAEAWSNRGNALSDLNRPDDARAAYDRALQIAPDFVDGWSNLGLTLVDLGLHDDALVCHDRAIALQPDAPEPHWNAALALLRTGRFERGWREYEWRWQRASQRGSARAIDVPLWLGDTSLDGKTILLHAEQGFGDTLQFCRYAPLAAARGATVVLEVQPELLRLMRSLDGVTHLIAQGDPVPPVDCHCPLLSLPLAFGTQEASVPASVPYLFADADESAAWRTRLADEGASRENDLKVGLVWAGGHRAHVPELRKNDARRSLSFDAFAPLIDVPGVQCVSLQVGAACTQWQTHPLASRVFDVTHALHDFAATAALVASLDLVITVDTAVAHLAGALGKPVWILNRFDSCWRWLRGRSDTPWYPTARLFEQPSLGDWRSVLADVQAALRERVSQPGHQPTHRE